VIEVIGTIGTVAGLYALWNTFRDLRRATGAKQLFERKLLDEVKASDTLRHALLEIGADTSRSDDKRRKALDEVEALGEFKGAVDKAVQSLGAADGAVVEKSLSRATASYLDDVVQKVSRDLAPAVASRSGS
jgi:hypothetical protein